MYLLTQLAGAYKVGNISETVKNRSILQGIDVASSHIQFTDAVKLLGVTLDSTLSFDKHVADVARQCHYHIRALKHRY